MYRKIRKIIKGLIYKHTHNICGNVCFTCPYKHECWENFDDEGL